MSDDSRWERVRVLVGVSLVVICGLALWKNSVRPLVEKGLGGGDLVHEVRLGVFRWALEKKRLQLQKEAEEEKAAQRPSEAEVGVSGGTQGLSGGGTLRGSEP